MCVYWAQLWMDLDKQTFFNVSVSIKCVPYFISHHYLVLGNIWTTTFGDLNLTYFTINMHEM